MKDSKTSLIFLIFIFVLYSVVATQAIGPVEPLAKITVETGQYDRIDTPVSVSLEAISDALKDAPIGLVELKGSESLPVASQVEPGDPPKLWWILSGTTPAGSERVYQIVPGINADAAKCWCSRKAPQKSCNIITRLCRHRKTWGKCRKYAGPYMTAAASFTRCGHRPAQF